MDGHIQRLRIYGSFILFFSKGLTSGCPKPSQKANQWLADYPKSEECISEPTFALSWSHYLILMRVENPDARSFYEIECTQQQWSKRQTQPSSRKLSL